MDDNRKIIFVIGVARSRTDSSRLARAVNWRPGTPVAEGVARFVEWYQTFHNPEPTVEVQ